MLLQPANYFPVPICLHFFVYRHFNGKLCRRLKLAHRFIGDDDYLLRLHGKSIPKGEKKMFAFPRVQSLQLILFNPTKFEIVYFPHDRNFTSNLERKSRPMFFSHQV